MSTRSYIRLSSTFVTGAGWNVDSEHSSRRLQVFDLRSHFISLIEAVVGVKIGIGKHGCRPRFYGGASNCDFRLADFAHARVHHGEH